MFRGRDVVAASGTIRWLSHRGSRCPCADSSGCLGRTVGEDRRARSATKLETASTGKGRIRATVPVLDLTTERRDARHRRRAGTPMAVPPTLGMHRPDRGRDLSQPKHGLSSHASAPKSPAHGYGYELSMSPTRSRARQRWFTVLSCPPWRNGGDRPAGR